MSFSVSWWICGNLKHRAKRSHFLLNDAMFCTMFFKNIAPDDFDDVLSKANHCTNDASNDVNRPPQAVLAV